LVIVDPPIRDPLLSSLIKQVVIHFSRLVRLGPILAARITRRLMVRWRIAPGAVAFDAGGGGQQIADALADRWGWEVSIVDFGAKPFRPAEYRKPPHRALRRAAQGPGAQAPAAAVALGSGRAMDSQAALRIAAARRRPLA
jgi:hypothetical protein